MAGSIEAFCSKPDLKYLQTSFQETSLHILDYKTKDSKEYKPYFVYNTDDSGASAGCFGHLDTLGLEHRISILDIKSHTIH